MENIPDAPWVRDPETYADAYYYGCYLEDDDEEDEEDQA